MSDVKLSAVLDYSGVSTEATSLKKSRRQKNIEKAAQEAERRQRYQRQAIGDEH